MKNLYFIRHGMAVHNVLSKKYGSGVFYSKYYQDCLLVPEGKKQSKLLGLQWQHKSDIQLVITSPLKRCLETTHLIFSENKIPVIVLDECIEYPQGQQYCNKRSTKNELEVLYPHYFFHNLVNVDINWHRLHNESLDELEKRIKKFNDFLYNRPERNIAIVTHTNFINLYKNNFSPIFNYDSKKELLHCHPYLHKL